MLRRIFSFAQTSFSYVWLVVLAAYFSVLAGQAIYRNYQSQQITTGLQKELSAAKLEKERLTALVVYYHTDAFKEKELRRSLLLKLPEEKVYALPESAIGQKIEEADIARLKEEERRSSDPNWKQWFDYLFGTSRRG
jgi:hypothetical protein